MKILFFFLFLISHILCNLDSCDEVKNILDCIDTKTNIDGISCFKVLFIDDNEIYCTAIPNTLYGRKTYWKLIDGMENELNSMLNIKEVRAKRKHIIKDETYERNEIIYVNKNFLTDYDKRILRDNNTCAYYFLGRLYNNNFLNNNNTGYINIEDQNTCFYADQFGDLYNLVDCGYANITYTVGNEKKIFKTCFYIPNNKMTKEIEFIFNIRYAQLFLETFPLVAFDDYYMNKSRLSSIKYEVVVENEYGKIVKYKSDSDEIEIIKEGNNNIELNIFLILSLLLFI